MYNSELLCVKECHNLHDSAYILTRTLTTCPQSTAHNSIPRGCICVFGKAISSNFAIKSWGTCTVRSGGNSCSGAVASDKPNASEIKLLEQSCEKAAADNAAYGEVSGL
jgi:hypothetical protein